MAGDGAPTQTDTPPAIVAVGSGLIVTVVDGPLAKVCTHNKALPSCTDNSLYIKVPVAPVGTVNVTLEELPEVLMVCVAPPFI